MRILNNRMEKVAIIVINEKAPGKPRIVQTVEPGREIQVSLKMGDKIVLN